MRSAFDICAIDAGQTNVRYLIFDHGQTISCGNTQAGILNFLLPEALQTLRQIIHRIVHQVQEQFGHHRFRVVSIGCSGIAKEREEYTLVLNEFLKAFHDAQVLLENDITLSHIANFQEMPGIILHAGTGAFAFGRDQHGKCLRTGGWGYLLGDQGAGFGLGLSALRAALQALEQTGPETSLKQELLPYFKISQLGHLKTSIYNANFHPAKIADFAKILFQHAEDRDPVALQLVEAGAKQMVQLVHPLLKQLDFERPDITLTGALYTNVNSYYTRCKLLLENQYTAQQVQVTLGTKSILDGALWLGMKTLGMAIVEEKR